MRFRRPPEFGAREGSRKRCPMFDCPLWIVLAYRELLPTSSTSFYPRAYYLKGAVTTSLYMSTLRAAEGLGVALEPLPDTAGNRKDCKDYYLLCPLRYGSGRTVALTHSLIATRFFLGQIRNILLAIAPGHKVSLERQSEFGFRLVPDVVHLYRECCWYPTPITQDRLRAIRTRGMGTQARILLHRLLCLGPRDAIPQELANDIAALKEGARGLGLLGEGTEAISDADLLRAILASV